MGKISGWADGSPPQGTDDIGGARAGANRRFPHKGLIYLPHNGIINPCFDVSQRNANNVVALTTSLVYGGPDRWVAAQIGAAAGLAQQFASTAAGMKNSFRLGRNAGSAGTGNIIMGQALESIDSIRYAGKRCTWSFLVATGGNFSASGFVPYIPCGTGTDQSLQTQVFSGWTGASSLVNTLQSVSGINQPYTRYSFQVDVPAGTTQIGFAMYYTPVGTAGADDSMYITDMRFYEANTDFTNYGLYRPYQQELALCQRYYSKSFPQGTAPAQNAGVTGSELFTQVLGAAVATPWGTVRYPSVMRTAPTVTLYNPSAANAQIRNASRTADGTGTGAINISDRGFNVSGTTAAGSAAGDFNYLQWAADSEI